MYQELIGGLLLRGQEEERERFRHRIHRLRELDRGDTPGPGWSSPATAVRRAPEPDRDSSREPSFWQWALAVRLAATKS